MIFRYSSVGSTVYGYDLRNTSSPIIKDCDYILDDLNGEEINQISFANHSNKMHIATADDDGFTRIGDNLPNRKSKDVNGQSNNTNAAARRCKQLQHDEDGSALVTSAVFRPRNKDLELATGGTDCTVCLWDVNRPHRPSSSLIIKRDDGEGVNQVCNPPIIHSLSWSPSGRLLAAGLGDGSAMIMQVEKRKLVEGCRLRGGHDSAIASVLFPNFGCDESSHMAAEDRLMVSGGNDGSIILWDIGKKMASNAVDPSSMFADCNNQTDGNAIDIDEAMNELSMGDDDPKILFGLRHGHKPNWIANSSHFDPVFSNSLFIADTSNDITAYILPR